jgi:type III secretory pathway component EscS
VLLNEKPELLPAFRQDRLIAYFLRSLLLGLIILLPAIVWGMIVGVLLSPLAYGGVGIVGILLVSVIIQLPLVFLGLRLSAALPGQALGVESDVLAGWRATAHDNRALAELAVLIVAAIFVVNLIGFVIFGHTTITSILWQVVTNWLVTMVGVSILTTLYGHYIQKRPLL